MKSEDDHPAQRRLARRVAVLAVGGMPRRLRNAGIIAVALSAAGPIASAQADYWQSAGNMSHLHANGAAAVLPGGDVLVAGGAYEPAGGGNPDYPYGSAADLYDPATGGWSQVASMNEMRAYQTATTLASGSVLVAGGIDDSGQALSSAEVYDPSTGSWSQTNPMTDSHAQGVPRS